MSTFAPASGNWKLTYWDSKSQLEYKLKKWNFRRELNQPQWWYVKRKIEHRKREKKESEVLLSGVPIHQNTIERETARLFLSTLDQIKGW